MSTDPGVCVLLHAESQDCRKHRRFVSGFESWEEAEKYAEDATTKLAEAGFIVLIADPFNLWPIQADHDPVDNMIKRYHPHNIVDPE